MRQSGKRPGILKRIARREFLISVQLDPPSPGMFPKFNDSLKKLRRAGVKVFDVNSSRRICHDSIQLASELCGTSADVIAHITTRDSSVNGLLNQILAAYEWSDLKNFLVITGDPYESKQAVFPSRGVFQTDSIGALKAIDWQFRKNLARPLNIVLAAAVNQNEHDRAKEGKRIEEKIAAGTDIFMSQPVFDSVQADELFKFYGEHSARPLFVGVWPTLNLKTIENIRAGSVEGVRLPRKEYSELISSFTDENELRRKSAERTIGLVRHIRSSGKARLFSF